LRKLEVRGINNESSRNFAGKTNLNHHYHITKETRTCDTMRSDSRDEMAGSGSRIAKLLFSLSSPELVTRYRYVALRDGTPPLPFPFMVDATQTQTRFALQRTLTTSLLPPCQVLHASPSSFTYLFFFQICFNCWKNSIPIEIMCFTYRLFWFF
jgi:hypothetical protein